MLFQAFGSSLLHSFVQLAKLFTQLVLAELSAFPAEGGEYHNRSRIKYFVQEIYRYFVSGEVPVLLEDCVWVVKHSQ